MPTSGTHDENLPQAFVSQNRRFIGREELLERTVFSSYENKKIWSPLRWVYRYARASDCLITQSWVLISASSTVYSGGMCVNFKCYVKSITEIRSEPSGISTICP
jgi:hypothetical protein